MIGAVDVCALDGEAERLAYDGERGHLDWASYKGRLVVLQWHNNRILRSLLLGPKSSRGNRHGWSSNRQGIDGIGPRTDMTWMLLKPGLPTLLNLASCPPVPLSLLAAVAREPEHILDLLDFVFNQRTAA